MLVFRLIVKSRSSVSRKIFIYYMGSVTFVILLFGILSYNYSRTVVIDKLMESSQETVMETGKRIDLMLDNYRMVTSQIASDSELRDVLAGESWQSQYQSDRLSNMLKTKFLGYSVNDPLMRLDLMKIDEAQKQDWLQPVLRENGKAAWLETTQKGYIAGKILNEPAFAVARTVNRQGTVLPLGVLIMEINTHSFVDKLVNVRFSGNLLVVDKTGKIMIAADSSQIGMTIAANQLQLTNGDSSGSARGVFVDGKEMMFVYHKSPVTGWILIGMEPVTEVTKETGAIWIYTMGMMLFALMLTGILGIFVIRNVGGPLHTLSSVMDKSRSGDLSVRAPVMSNDEIGQVSRSLNQMMDQVQLLMKEAEESVYLHTRLEAESEQRRIADHLTHSITQLSSSLKLEEVLYRIFPLLNEFAPIVRGSLWMRDDEERLRLKVQKNGPALVYEEHFVEMETLPDSVCSSIFSSDPIALDNEIAQKSFAALLPDEELGNWGWMLYPFVYQRKTLGFLLLDCSHLTDKEKQYVSLFAAQASITIMNALIHEDMRKQATVDGLTGIYNRRFIFFEAERLCSTEQSMRFCVILFDIDHFKSVNDQYGHAAGDEVLRQVAACTRLVCGNKGIPGRYGGEEFVILLPNTEPEEAYRMAEELRGVIENHVNRYDNQEIMVTISMGIASSETNVSDFQEVLFMADNRLYQAKRAGRNCIR